MVEDHSASAEYTPAEYTPARYGPVYTGPQYTGDGGQDLRPDPVADFRTEVPPPEFPTEFRPEPDLTEFGTEPAPTEFRTEPAPTGSQTEPAQFEFPIEPAPTGFPTEPAQPAFEFGPEPDQTDPIPTERVHAEPVPAEPIRAEAIPTEAIQPDPIPAEPIPTERVQTEPVPAAPIRAAPIRAAAIPTEAIQPDPIPTERVQAEPIPAEPIRVEAIPAEPADVRNDIPLAPEPEPRIDPGHLSPSLPIPTPETPESGYRPAARPEYDGYRYRSDLERAATDFPTGPMSEPPTGTAYFDTAPAVGNLGYPSQSNSTTWSREQYPTASTDGGDGVARNEGDARAHGTPDEQHFVEPQPVDPRPAPVLQTSVSQTPVPAPAAPAAPVMDLGDAWTRVLAGLPPNQRAWLTNSRPVTLHESTAIVAVPDDFTRGQLETRLRPDLERILTESFGRDIRIAVTVDPSLDPEVREQQPAPQPVVREPLRTEGAYQPTIQSALSDPDRGPQFSPPRPEPAQQQHYEQPAAQQYAPPQQQQQPQQQFGQQQPMPNGAAPAHQPTEGQGEARLNPKYTFETFVIGSSNRFAHAAAVAVAEAPGKAYNPQLIYGDSGLGKTHLLHAIGHYVRSLYTGARVRYVSSEEFTNDFINAIRDDKASQFQRRYRDVDVLLIDDIQFLEGKIQTQEEFFHTFNTLHNANKQIVISSDRAPKRLEALEDRLRNRFEWGLITDIQPPDLETRIAILRKKAATERLTAPPEVLEFIASKVQTNIRELEGALIRVTAFASLNRQPVDLSLAEIVLKDLIPEGSKPEVTASMIMGQTASYFGLSIDDLCGSSRSRVLVTARQIAMYLCRELTDLSLPKIGQQFGGRDHTTVMHAERKIRQLMSERRSVFNQVTELTNRIKHQAKQQ